MQKKSTPPPIREFLGAKAPLEPLEQKVKVKVKVKAKKFINGMILPESQVFKHASVQVYMYAGMQVCKYASMQVCKYASMQVCKYASFAN